MLKIQELRIDGEVFFVREPRVRDYLDAKTKGGETDYVYVLMGGMILNQDKEPIGMEGVMNLPLRVFDTLNKAVEELNGTRSGPLDQTGGSSTA